MASGFECKRRFALDPDWVFLYTYIGKPIDRAGGGPGLQTGNPFNHILSFNFF
jgi:hypothetical protein